MSQISTPVGSLAPLCHVMIQGEVGNLQPEATLTRTQACWHLVLILKATTSRTEKFVVYKPLILIAA